MTVFGRIGDRRRLPIVTGLVFAVTATTSITQLVNPSAYERFSRNGARIGDGEWWRLLTAMFVQDGWLQGTVFNLFTLAAVGVFAERVLGRRRWLVVYFGCGLFGQVMSYLWFRSDGAGNSMCVAGLVGALTTVVLVARSRWGLAVPRRLLLVGFLVPVLAVAGTIAGDNHGLPCLLGIAMALVLLPRRLQPAVAVP